MNPLIFLADSYKVSHWNQYPPGISWMQSYLECRGGEYGAVVFFGLQYYIQRYLCSVPTTEEVLEAEDLSRRHGLDFNRLGWERVRSLGYIPVKIYAVPEGSVCPPRHVLMTVESTDPSTPWIVSWLETLLLKVWYPCTVATKAYHVRRILEECYEKAGIEKDAPEYASIDHAYHNFGDRGSTSVEAAALGGAAHLTQFKGTDNFASLRLVEDIYGTSDSCAGFSIPASEHSTVTTWGEHREYEMISAYLEKNRGGPAISCVIDSYNLYDAVRYCCGLKVKVESEEYPILVMRPDSGSPLEIIPQILRIMSEYGISFTVRNHLRTFKKFRILWGDGITPATIKTILESAMQLGFSPLNFVFGSGGDLMQNINRDTCQFALKCCSARFGNSEHVSVEKKPMHDPAKHSIPGRKNMLPDLLRFDSGKLVHTASFDDIRELSRKTRALC